MNLLQEIEQQEIRKLTAKRPVPDFAPGDTVRVGVRIVEGEKSRVQVFEGVCIARKNGGLNSSFTVRRRAFDEGVERVFPLYGPVIDHIEVVRKGRVRRAKLYYQRGRTGKAARIRELQSGRRLTEAGVAAAPAAAAEPAVAAGDGEPAAAAEAAPAATPETAAPTESAPTAAAPATDQPEAEAQRSE